MSGHPPWRRVHRSSNPEYEARLAKVKADVEAKVVAAGKWMCPQCWDWIGPEDDLGSPPVCDMCKLAGQIAEDHWLPEEES